MEYSHAHSSGGASGAHGSGVLNINYEELRTLGDYLRDQASGMQTAVVGEWDPFSRSSIPKRHSPNVSIDITNYAELVGPISWLTAVKFMGVVESHIKPAWKYREMAGSNFAIIGTMLQNVADLCEEGERNALARNTALTTTHHLGTFAPSVEGMAAGYYAQAVADRDQAEADRIQAEKDAADQAKKESEKAERLAAIMAFLGTVCPNAADELQWKLWDAQMQETIDYFRNGEGNDPELADLIEKEWEAQKKAREEAKKAAAELEQLGEQGLGLDGEGVDGGLGLGGGGSSDFGGGGGLGDLGGSDFGGGGGFGGFDDASLSESGLGDDWGSEDWASDMLGDALDTEGLSDAAGALDDLTDSGLGGALGTSLEDAAAADVAASGFWAEHGAQLAEVAERYGVQAGMVLGGAAALYLTREQTTEAVAHVAEFVSTKCRPAVDDVMDQVRGAAKKTRVRVSNATSGVKSAVRGEGDLIG